ncbi:MAG: hypothetical protein LZF62_380149 [Nitrospira sp.]|nr:MAG: hypothetical protein LZF62_380149 [Nitrospira sp.]
MATKGYYNDNLLLTPLPHTATYGYWISPAAEFAGRTERLEVTGRAALDFVDYYGGEPTRFTNVFLPLTANYKTENDLFGFSGGFTRDNTLMGELLATGLVLRFTQRNQWNVSPSWTRNITEKLAFQGAFQFSDTSYQDGLRLGLQDYQLFGGSAGLLYHATERDDIQLAWNYTNFHTTNSSLNLRATYPGIMLNVSHLLTETLKGTAYGGPRFLSSTTRLAESNVSTQDTIWVYGAGLTQQFESATLQFTLAREIMPSGFGLLVKSDRAGLLASYNLTETLTGSLDLSGYLVSGASPLATGGTLSTNQLFYSTPKITWKFAEWWKLEASYSYRWRDADALIEPVMSNATMLMLTYYPPKLAISD